MRKRTDKLAPCHKKSTPATDKHCTPKAFFLAVQKKFGVKFTLDIAASKANRLCKYYIDERKDALKSTWAGTAWCNPPYSNVFKFLQKIVSNNSKYTFVLLATRSDTEWFHKFSPLAYKRIWIKGRLKFVGSKGGAPFPSVLLVFKRGHNGPPEDIYWAPTPYERGFQRGKPKTLKGK